MNKKIRSNYDSLILNQDDTILNALKKMDLQGSKLLMVANEGILLGLVSIGDIQRAILNSVPLEDRVEQIMRTDIIVASVSDSLESIKTLMLQNRVEYMPVLDHDNKIVNVIFWNDLFDDTPKNKGINLGLPVVIMAGGLGTRMKPLTNVIPKPLIPMGEKTIIETIMDMFTDVGCYDFHISVNYKAETIKHYFKQLGHPEYKISYFQEEKPLGTAGSLFLLKGKIDKTFFISNCDIIINTDFNDILEYHREQNNELTIVSALKHYPIPYGTIETGENGALKELIEKPEIIFQINSGMYILEPHLIYEIPENKFFHVTKLIDNILKRKGRVGVFPVSEGSWIDIGDWKTFTSIHNQ